MARVPEYLARIVGLNGGVGELRAGVVFRSVQIDGTELELQAVLAHTGSDWRAPPDALELDLYYPSGLLAASYAGPLAGDLERVRGHVECDVLDEVLDALDTYARIGRVPF